MPTYTYECRDCGHTYDAFQSMKSDPDTVCPKCNGRVERRFGGGSGILFKGSGFYVTDYKSGSSGNSATAPAAASTSSTESSSKESSPTKTSSSESGS